VSFWSFLISVHLIEKDIFTIIDKVIIEPSKIMLEFGNSHNTKKVKEAKYALNRMGLKLGIFALVTLLV
jgi:hypothetical protein